MQTKTIINVPELLALAVKPVATRIKCWQMERLTTHYDMCAAVEAHKAREALRNEAYFQKRAALLRSELKSY